MCKCVCCLPYHKTALSKCNIKHGTKNREDFSTWNLDCRIVEVSKNIPFALEVFPMIVSTCMHFFLKVSWCPFYVWRIRVKVMSAISTCRPFVVITCTHTSPHIHTLTHMHRYKPTFYSLSFPHIPSFQLCSSLLLICCTFSLRWKSLFFPSSSCSNE